MIDPSERFGISINKAFISIMVVLYSSSSRTLERNSAVIILNHESAFIYIFFLDNKALFLPLSNKIFKILSMILPFLIAPNKAQLFFVPFPSILSTNKNILKDTFGREGNKRYFMDGYICFHLVMIKR